jgi:hypothetical protein
MGLRESEARKLLGVSVSVFGRDLFGSELENN